MPGHKHTLGAMPSSLASFKDGNEHARKNSSWTEGMGRLHEMSAKFYLDTQMPG
jgi:hypothetical protein